jgi:AraC-like DNA-binding protein
VESSSFVRAVQRWTGKSPGEVRRTSAQVDSTTSD